jgi:hypothetical protein
MILMSFLFTYVLTIFLEASVEKTEKEIKGNLVRNTFTYGKPTAAI